MKKIIIKACCQQIPPAIKYKLNVLFYIHYEFMYTSVIVYEMCVKFRDIVAYFQDLGFLSKKTREYPEEVTFLTVEFSENNLKVYWFVFNTGP